MQDRGRRDKPAVETRGRAASLIGSFLFSNDTTETKNYFIQCFLIRFRFVARLARVIAVGIAHHATQRGNGRRFLLASDVERRVYLDLLRENLAADKVLSVGYCLMSNRVHLIVVPQDAEGLPLFLKHTHGRYASYWNVAHHANGHVWQGRYYSCPLDGTHLWEALRYTELNPVRAGLVAEARSWTCSSAVAHRGWGPAERFLNMELWQGHWTSADWQSYLRREKPMQHWLPDGRWVHKNSLRNWRNRCTDSSFRRGVAGRQNHAPIQDKLIFLSAENKGSN